ncbi:EF-hand calcium-binding domain-containing protein 6 [Thamnophis elegans]|uniref:EF-hand calcium-binding domain-containing protein 6 n=1 Tax=Thamnophis elegans TaxID=35005 RepID=UPI0013768F16|nr:EF-hand calcium-binding domain-containing protein 6 [Thamnophis elegans]
MSRVVNACDYKTLCPQSHGIVFNSRAQSNSSGRTSTRSSSNSSSSKTSSESSVQSESTVSVNSVPDSTLSSDVIEQILLQKITAKEDEIKKAFQIIDIDQTLKITKGEFRRVIETFILPLTDEQFNVVLAKVPGITRVTVPYLEFLSMFSRPISSVNGKWNNLRESRTRTLSQMECLLREKISKKIKHFIKTCRLFDYNQNGQIQRHELRRILEINCFKMTDCEYDKLWNRYCISRTNTLNYKEFLQYLGISLEKKKKKRAEKRIDSGRHLKRNESPESKTSESKMSLPATTGYNLTKIHLDNTAKNFREKLRSVYEDVVKAFRAYDVGRSGFVSLEYLKSVLSTFIFPIQQDVFQELMNRFGIRLSKNMAWEKFLSKFQDPLVFDSGQASSKRKHHRSRKLDEALSGDRILLKLHGHIQDAYSSLKKAFLMLDRNQDGKITRNELRRILDCIMFRISDDDFQELIKIIDPDHTGHLSYNEFLNLFEKDFVTDSKWATSSKKAKKPTSVLEAWNIAEDVLTEQVKGYWNEFNKALQACDSRNEGIISRNNFRKILQLYCPTLTDDHFIALYQKYQDDTTEGVLYKMLLHSLGVSDLPKELTADTTSTSSPRETQQAEEKKPMDLPERMKQIEDHIYKQARNRTVDEVLERLRDGILHQEMCMRDAFLAYNKQASGKLTKTDFRKLLEDIQMPMSDDHFNLLIEKIGFPVGGLSYLDFVAMFEDSRLCGACSNRQVNASKSHFMSAEECLSQYSDKLADEYGDAYIAFRKIDKNSDGVVTMLDFRRLLDNLMISMTDEEFVRLLGMLGMNETSTLNYPEFLQLFQTHTTKEMRPWLTTSYKPRRIVADANLACEQAHNYLSIKAQNRWGDLAMHFHEYDADGNAIVTKKDLKDVLFRCGIPVNPKEFEKLWARYDLNAKGYLTHQDFLQKMGVENVPSDSGLNKQFSADDYRHFLDHYKRDEKKHIDINEIINKIREKYHEFSQDFHRAFLQQDKHKEGCISVDSLRKILEDFQCSLGYEQYSELLYSLGINIHENKLSYFDFLRLIDDRAAFRYKKKHTVPPIPPISFVQLSIDEAMAKIKQMVTDSSDLLYKAFSAFDKDHTGTVSTLEFRQVLHHFCFTLSEKQFSHLLKLQRLRGEHAIDWKHFLQKFNFLSEAEREQTRFACWDLSNQEVLARIQEVVSARFQAIEQEFKNADSTKTNLVPKEVFRDICNRRFLLLTDEQFENLWNTVPLDLSGKLKYSGFLRNFSSEGGGMSDMTNVDPSKPPLGGEPESRIPLRPKTATQSPKKVPGASRPNTAPVPTPPILNCQPIESKIRKNVQHCWKEILKECREKDVERSGEISVEDILGIIEKFHLNLTNEEIQQLITKYDLKSVGKFAYCDFLQSCVLLFKHQEVPPLQRLLIQTSRVQSISGPQSPTFLNAMMRIQPQILHCWRPMRRTFKFYDESGTGLLSIQDFRQVLRKYGINLSEEEFFHILEYYDKNLTSKISYNEFLRAFLQ